MLRHHVLATVKLIPPGITALAVSAALTAAACAPVSPNPKDTRAGTGAESTPVSKLEAPVPALSAHGSTAAAEAPSEFPSGAPSTSTGESCSAQEGWGIAEQTGGTTLTPASLYRVRAGKHSCYDRAVFDLNGPEPVGYTVGYVPLVWADGSGEPVPVHGGAALQVAIGAPIHGNDQQGHQP
jgi:hypothetical protein